MGLVHSKQRVNRLNTSPNPQLVYGSGIFKGNYKKCNKQSIKCIMESFKFSFIKKKISQNNLSSNNIDMDMYIVNRLLEINKDIFFSLSLSADIWPDPYSAHNKM